ncbi:uncharacterized protein LOC104584302 [Brachypodium distachyon]|uniref:uncharacterized protein LOC104584302 n=1 Tax=Brachypodium distachyon TaxID=15368 RepID=UPI00052FF273|nr:uncharacterized protein LOC104584302 [Brachypodium distachyon]|eukprot:XP_010236858.1 uncharacterized protein LOC104584302 [Brachypodium distachyon]
MAGGGAGRGAGQFARASRRPAERHERPRIRRPPSVLVLSGLIRMRSRHGGSFGGGNAGPSSTRVISELQHGPNGDYGPTLIISSPTPSSSLPSPIERRLLSSDPTPPPRPPVSGSDDTPASTPTTKAATSPPSPFRSPSRRPAPRLRSPVAEAPRTRGCAVQGNGVQLQLAVAVAVPVALVAMGSVSRQAAAAARGLDGALTCGEARWRQQGNGGRHGQVPNLGCSLSIMDDLLNNYAEEMVNYCTMASNSSFLEMLASTVDLLKEKELLYQFHN